jgi:hypothetical protein
MYNKNELNSLCKPNNNFFVFYNMEMREKKRERERGKKICLCVRIGDLIGKSV